jgi:hypothetical protein
MPAMIVPRETTDMIETTAVSGRRGLESTMLHTASLQNPTEWRRDSPFFGSVMQDPNVSVMRLTSTKIENIDISEFKPKLDLS